MVQIGNVTLDAPFFQAGLAGYSDAAMRLVARRHGCPYCVTEAMLDHFLIQGGKGLKHAELDDEDHPVAGQLMGSHPDEIAAGAKILVQLGYDVIDINLACPVKKIKKKSRGGHLLSVPSEARSILNAVKQAVGDDVPCTVKLRRGSDDSSEARDDFMAVFQSAVDLGYAGAVVHGRTVEQKYVGNARWEFLRELVGQQATNGGKSHQPRATSHEGVGDSETPGGSVARGSTPAPFLIGGSGDIWRAADIFRMIDQTGVQLVSVARGCIGNPWIFEQARAIMRGDLDSAHRSPTIFEQRDVLREHFDLSVKLHGERKAGLMMRKFGIKFSCHHPRGVQVKAAFIRVKCLDDWRDVLGTFYGQDGPGIEIDAEAVHTGEANQASCDVEQVTSVTAA